MSENSLEDYFTHENINTKESKLIIRIYMFGCVYQSEKGFLQALCNVSAANRFDIICGSSERILGHVDTAGWNVLKTMRCAFQDFTINQKYKLLEADLTLSSAINLGSLQLIEYFFEGLTEAQVVSLLERKDKYGGSALHLAREAPFEVLNSLLEFVSWEKKTALITREFSPLHCFNYICRLNGLWTKKNRVFGERAVTALSESDEKIQELEKRCTSQAADVDSLKDELNTLRQEKTKLTQDLADAIANIGALDSQRQQQAADVSSLKYESEDQKMQQQRENAQLADDLGDANAKVGALDFQCQQQAEDVNSLRDELENQNMQQQREKTQSILDLVEANTKVGALDLQCQRQAADVSSLRDELENQKRQQQREKSRLANELDSSKRKTESLEAICTTQASSIDFLKSHHHELRRENIQLLEETRRQAVKQERMEGMMEEMERLLRQPICIGPEMDQEHEE